MDILCVHIVDILQDIRIVKSLFRSILGTSTDSPYMVMFGREIRTRLDTKISSPPEVLRESRRKSVLHLTLYHIYCLFIILPGIQNILLFV